MDTHRTGAVPVQAWVPLGDHLRRAAKVITVGTIC